MKRTLILFAATFLFLVNCNNNPIAPSTGELNIRLTWMDEDSDTLQKSGNMQGNPSNIKIILKLYGAEQKEYTFNYSDGSGEISGLQQNEYSIDVYATDADGCITHTGATDNVDVKAGQKTTVNITMKSFIPVNIEATDSNWMLITVSWDAPPGEIILTTYKVYRATSSDGIYTLVRDSNNNTSYMDSDTNENSWYYYKISAVCAKGESPKSAYVAGYRTEFN